MKLSAANSNDAARYVREAAHAKGWIIDTRGSSSQSFDVTLGASLLDKESPFRIAPRAMLVGSTTAGAVADQAVADQEELMYLVLPMDLEAATSGIGVFYPDKRSTQRVGIVPDIPVKPTIAGILAGRDEVLEVGLRQMLARTKQPLSSMD